MDINRELRSAIGTGKVTVGTKQTLKAVKKGKAKLIILTKNTHNDTVKEITRKKGISIYRFDGTNLELGAACGKPYAISVLSILDPGDSDILALQADAETTAPVKKAVKKKVAK